MLYIFTFTDIYSINAVFSHKDLHTNTYCHASGLGISTKYVGLFVFCYVGLSTVERLWELLAACSPNTFVAHFLARLDLLNLQG